MRPGLFGCSAPLKGGGGDDGGGGSAAAVARADRTEFGGGGMLPDGVQLADRLPAGSNLSISLSGPLRTSTLPAASSARSIGWKALPSDGRIEPSATPPGVSSPTFLAESNPVTSQ